jgi:purine-cytosine permease-like protein
VVTSGLAPFAFGLLIDGGVTIEVIAAASVSLLVIGTALAWFAVRDVAGGKPMRPAPSKRITP